MSLRQAFQKILTYSRRDIGVLLQKPKGDEVLKLIDLNEYSIRKLIQIPQ
jgi:hypothetical protein